MNIDIRFGKGRVRPESYLLALRLLALNLRQQQLIPVFGAVHIARTQLRRQAVPMTIELGFPRPRDARFGRASFEATKINEAVIQWFSSSSLLSGKWPQTHEENDAERM